MKSIRPKNNRRKSLPETRATVFALLFAATSLLLLPGCRDPLGLQEDTANRHGQGTFSLTIGEQGLGRAIMPGLPSVASIRYDLVFTPHDDCTADNTPFTVQNWNLNQPVEINSGLWNLTVNAYRIDLEPRRRFATRSYPDAIRIEPGFNTAANITLEPINTGTGTFTWHITILDDIEIVGATVEIMQISEESAIPDSFIGTVDTLNTRSLPAGRYRVVFRLSNDQGERAVINEVLHIYENLTSHFSLTLTRMYFPTSLLNIILNAWNAGGTIQENLTDAGISAGHFGLLGINGVTGGNFASITGRFDTLVADAPTDEDKLKEWVDAALISIEAGNPAFTRASNVWTQAFVNIAINDTAANITLETGDFDWTGDYTVTVTVGGHKIPITFVPVPVTGVRITSPTPAPTEASPYRLEATSSWDFTAEVEPSYARYRGIRWEIPNAADQAFVEITGQNEATGTATIRGLSAGLAHVYAVSVANDTHRVRVPIDVFPYGAGVPITDIAITNAPTITLEVGESEDLVLVRTPSNTTQLGVTVNSSALGVVTIDGLRITGAYPGTVTVTVAATANPGVYDTIIVIVPPTPRTVDVSPATVDVSRNRTQQFSHTVLHGAGDSAGVPQYVTWTATPETYATIDNYGMLTLLPTATIGGTVTVRATTTHANAVYGEATVTVLHPVPESVSIAGARNITLERGNLHTFTATVLPEGAPPAVTWTLVPTDVNGVTINPTNGELTIHSDSTLAHNETFNVRATVVGHSGLQDEITVTVRVPPTSVAIDSYVATMIRGTTQTFTATAGPLGAYQGVIWSVEPSSAGSFANNVLTIYPGTNPGDVTITATTGFPGPTVSGNATINVVHAAPTNLGVTVTSTTATSATIERGGAGVSFTASMSQPQGIPAIGTVSWRIEPTNAGSLSATTGQTVTVTVGTGNTPYASFEVIARVVGYEMVGGVPMVTNVDSNRVSVNVREPGDFDVIPPPFPPEHGGIELNQEYLEFSLIGTPVPISVTNYTDFEEIRWYFEGVRINDADTGNESFVGDNGATLTVRRMMNGRLLSVGTHFLTVEALMRIPNGAGGHDSEWRSRRIELRVDM